MKGLRYNQHCALVIQRGRNVAAFIFCAIVRAAGTCHHAFHCELECQTCLKSMVKTCSNCVSLATWLM